MQNKKIRIFLITILIFTLCLLCVSCNNESDDNSDDIPDEDKSKTSDKEPDKEDEKIDSIIIYVNDEISFYLESEEDNKTEIKDKNELENYLNKRNDSKAVFYLIKNDDELSKEEITNEDIIKGYINCYFDIYVVSSKTSEMNDGDVIKINGQCAIVGYNAFNTMANVLIYVNALPKSSHPVIYLDSGEYNEVFNLYHDNIFIFGICSGLTEQERSEMEESIFTGSVSIKGNSIRIKGVAVDDLEQTFIVTGNDFIQEEVVLNKK